MRELVAVFRADAPRLLAEIAAALDDDNAEQLDSAAHSLKGMLGFFQLATATASAAALSKRWGEAVTWPGASGVQHPDRGVRADQPADFIAGDAGS